MLTNNISTAKSPSVTLSDTVICLGCLNEADCPPGYLFSRHEDCFVFYKILLSDQQIPEVTESMHIGHDLHVKLFIGSLSVPLPQWFGSLH